MNRAQKVKNENKPKPHRNLSMRQMLSISLKMLSMLLVILVFGEGKGNCAYQMSNSSQSNFLTRCNLEDTIKKRNRIVGDYRDEMVIIGIY